MKNLKTWIGKRQIITDRLTPEMVKRFNVTVNDCDVVDGRLLNGLHYALGNEALPRDQLGIDSHPAKGGFLPPIELPRRMWAGSKVKFMVPLPVGEDIDKISTIEDIVPKKSASGDLVFVTVRHDYKCDDEVLISEIQTIVYRDAVSFKQAKEEELPTHTFSKSLIPDATQLFRYSAITFNGHRIHYDQDYATGIEGYPGLVVHGPLIATWLMNFAQEMCPDQSLRSFEFRGNAPAFVENEIILLALDENCTAFEARTKNGALIMTANAGFGDILAYPHY